MKVYLKLVPIDKLYCPACYFYYVLTDRLPICRWYLKFNKSLRPSDYPCVVKKAVWTEINEKDYKERLK